MSAPTLFGWTPGQWMAVMRHFGEPAPTMERALELRRIWETHAMSLDIPDDPIADATTTLFMNAEENLKGQTSREFSLFGEDHEPR